MKKVLFSVCCTLLIAGFSVAQQGTTITPPAAPTPDEAPAVVEVQATETVQVQEAAKPSEDTAVEEVVVEQAAPADVAVEEVIIDNSTVLNAPMIEGTPVYGGSVMAPIVVDPAGVASTECNNCNNNRRAIVRTVTTRGRSVLTRVRCLVSRRR